MGYQEEKRWEWTTRWKPNTLLLPRFHCAKLNINTALSSLPNSTSTQNTTDRAPNFPLLLRGTNQKRNQFSYQFFPRLTWGEVILKLTNRTPVLTDNDSQHHRFIELWKQVAYS